MIAAAPPPGACFPAADQPAAPKALARAADLRRLLPPQARSLMAPSLAARQTAEALGLPALEEPALADCDLGAWAGRDPAEVAADHPAALALWLAEAGAAPHGGESRAQLRQRVAAWMGGLAVSGGPIVAVSHPAPIRAAILTALAAPDACEAGLDIAAPSLVRLSHDGRRWRWRAGLRDEGAGPADD